MADKVPVTVFVDPNVETQLTIKPFAAGLATRPAQPAAGAAGAMPAGVTASATGTYVGGQVDADADVDYNG